MIIYGNNDFLPILRDLQEKQNPNPVYKMFMEEDVAITFSKQGTRETVLPGYMGLIKQIDDHLGDLFKFLDDQQTFFLLYIWYPGGPIAI